MAIFTKNELKKAIGSKTKKLSTMTDEQLEELDEKAISIIRLWLATYLLHEVLDKATTRDLWLQLEELYMTKSLANKIRRKERLYTFSMVENSRIQNHLDESNFIIFDWENLDAKSDDEDKVVLLVIPLPISYKHFKEIWPWGLCWKRRRLPIEEWILW